MTASFCVVVVIHDSAAELAVLLASLRQHLPDPPELVVVDAGSRDGGAALASEHGAEVVERPDNPGFGPASNAGVERARAEVTILLNPDIELRDGALAELARRAEARNALLAPRLLEADGRVQRTAHPVPGRLDAFLPALVHPPLLPRGPRLAAEPWRAEEPRAVGWAVAACLAARTDVLRRLGPFDPTAFLFYEDLDLCLRARAAGVATELHPDLVLRHSGAHATGPAFGGEPFELLARRRREVIRARLGRRALALDDAAQALTFATRTAGRRALRRDAARPRAQLHALRRARKDPTGVDRR